MIPRVGLIDPRPEDRSLHRPIADAVRICVDELSQRTHELPPRSAVILIADTGADAVALLDAVQSMGRTARLTDAWQPATGPSSPGRLWSAAAWVEELIPHWPPARAIDLACGCGRDEVFLAAHGWQVRAIDIDPTALQRGQDLQERYAPACPPIQWIEADAERWAPSGQTFDLILCMRFLSREMLQRAATWLSPGGSLLVETFTTIHRAAAGRPRSDARVLRPNELPELLSNLSLRRCDEDWRDAHTHTARAWGVR